MPKNAIDIFQIMVAALKFFLGSDVSGEEEDSDDEEDEVSKLFLSHHVPLMSS